MRNVKRTSVSYMRALLFDAIVELSEERDDWDDDDAMSTAEERITDALSGATCEPGDMAVEDDYHRKCTIISHPGRLAVIAHDDGAFISNVDEETRETWTLVLRRWPPKLSCYMS